MVVTKSFAAALQYRYCRSTQGDAPITLGGKLVQLVGAHQIENRFLDVNNLTAIDLSYMDIDDVHSQGPPSSCPCPLSKIADNGRLAQFPHCRYLALSKSKLPAISCLFSLLSRMPSLVKLEIVQLPFRGETPADQPVPHMDYVQQKHDVYHTVPFTFPLESLIMNGTDLLWEDIILLLPRFPNLSYLNLSQARQLKKLPSEMVGITSIKELHLESVAFDSWTMIHRLFNLFPNLRKLNISQSPELGDKLGNGGLVSSEKVELNIENCGIASWSTFHYLYIMFPHITSIRWQQNPLQLTGGLSTREVSLPKEEFSRQVAVTLLPTLQSYNGGPITEEERRQAELYGLAILTRQPHLTESLREEFRIYHLHRLQTKFGERAPNYNATPLTQATPIIHLKLKDTSSGATVEKDVAAFISVKTLKLMCHRAFHIDLDAIALHTILNGRNVSLDCEEEQLSSLGLASGDACEVYCGIIPAPS